MSAPEKAGDYEIIQSVRLGGRVMLLGYNPHDKEATYMTCYQHFNLLGEKTYPLAVASENYLEIMQEFLKRVQEQQQDAVAFRAKRNVPIEILGEEHCRQRGEEESLEGKLVRGKHPLRPPLRKEAFMRNRPIKLSVRVNQTEYQYLTLQADSSGLSKEAFIRKRIMGEPIKARPPQELPELLRLLKSTSDNINQIARATNARHFVRSEELEEIYSRLDDIWSKVKEL